MKKFLAFLVIVVVVCLAIYFFAPWRSWPIIAGLFSPRTTEIGTGASTGGNTGSGGKVLSAASVANSLQNFGTVADNFASTTGQVLGAAISNVVSSAVGGAIDSAKDAAVQTIAGALGVSTSIANNGGTPAVVIAGGSGTGGGSGTNGSAAGANSFAVCDARSKGESVSYLLEFSTSSPATGYAVDWGDNESTTGVSTPSVPTIVVSHAYGATGDYTVNFKAAASGPVLAQKEVCVQ